MHICISCQGNKTSENWQCLTCGWQPKTLNNYLSFSPELAIKNDGFNPDDFEFLAMHEAQHFWFRARNRLINWGFKKYFSKAKNFLEIGCGTGYVLSNIEKTFPTVSVMGSDIYVASLPYAQNRLSGKHQLFQMDAKNIPYSNHFDVIGAFDVLEHIQEDEIVIREMYKALNDTGGLILTVPQHPSLWSQSDKIACHVRRYETNELQEKLERAGFTIKTTTSFVSLLLPLVLLSRSCTKENFSQESELIIPKSINFCLEKILNFEIFLISKGIRFPVGSTRFIVATKK